MKKLLITAAVATALVSGVALTHAIAQGGHGHGHGGPRGDHQMHEQMQGRMQDRQHRHRHDGQYGRMNEGDRAAMLEARLAGIKAGLKLTPEQEKLWPSVEAAVRDNIKKMTELRDKRQTTERANDPVEQMRRQADDMSARADAMRNVANAAQPLYATLNDDQKRRLPMLMRIGQGQGYGHYEGGHHRHH